VVLRDHRHNRYFNTTRRFVPPSEEADLDEQTSRANGGPFFRAAANSRLQRARSIAAIPSNESVGVQLRARSTSLCSSASNLPPDVIIPPLPLDIARIKSEAKRRSQLRRISSKLSVQFWLRRHFHSRASSKSDRTPGDKGATSEDHQVKPQKPCRSSPVLRHPCSPNKGLGHTTHLPCIIRS
jgi:hypothetical protein